MAACQVLTLLLVGQLVALAGAVEYRYSVDWLAGYGTWYGEPNGEGSSAGACGYTQLTGTPYGNKIAAANAVIYRSGKGCGHCYDVKCSHSSCNPTPTRIVITDLCPGGTYCSTNQPAFDFSGAAISAMAKPGQESTLRNVGLYDIQYKRVPCSYPNQKIAFKMDPGSNSYWLSFVVKYLGGPGGILFVQLKQKGGSYQLMQHNWGANWVLINHSDQPFQGPFTVMIVTLLNLRRAIAIDVIPHNFQPGKLYESKVQLTY